MGLARAPFLTDRSGSVYETAGSAEIFGRNPMGVSVRLSMRREKSVLLWITQGPGPVRQVPLPRGLLFWGMAFLLVVTGAMAWGWKAMEAAQARLSRLAHLEREMALRDRQMGEVVHRIQALSEKIEDARLMDERIRLVMCGGRTGDEPDGPGMGGSEGLPARAMETPVLSRLDPLGGIHERLDAMDELIRQSEERKKRLLEFLEEQRPLLDRTPSIWPTRGELSSSFGYRISPFTGKREFHKGIDISAPLKAPVVAVADGIVAAVDRTAGYGKVITLRHGNGLETTYAQIGRAHV